MCEKINYLDVKEFRVQGYLQEINRVVLHPLGLALEIQTHDDGTESFGGVWDYRSDPEGIMYGDALDKDKRENIRKLTEKRRPPRELALGYWIQEE